MLRPLDLLVPALLIACRTEPLRTKPGPPDAAADTATPDPDPIPDTGDAPDSTPDSTPDSDPDSNPVPDTTAPRGWVDHVDCDGVWGWALDDDSPDTSLQVTVDFGGTRVTAAANQPRPDVCGSSPCDHGFSVPVPDEVADGSVRAVTVYAIDAQSGIEQPLGGADLSCGGGEGEGEGEGEDDYTYLYSDGDSYVRYHPVTDVFEKVDSSARDTGRRMMPIDLHTWSIANFDRDLLMYSHFALLDEAGYTLFEYNDTEGAVHVSLAETARETERGNNHQTALSEFLIVEGDYQIEYTLSSDSLGHPSLMLWRQREGNRFLMVVGADVTGVEQDSVDGEDGITVDFGETVTRSFTVGFLDEDNALYKSNANGFEP